MSNQTSVVPVSDQAHSSEALSNDPVTTEFAAPDDVVAREAISPEVVAITTTATNSEITTGEIAIQENPMSDIATLEAASVDHTIATVGTDIPAAANVDTVVAPTPVAASNPVAPASPKKHKRHQKKNKSASTPVTSNEQPKSVKKPQVHTPVLVESGQELMGKVSGFSLGDDKLTRTGVVLRFKGGDSAFMHSSQIGGHFPDSRLNSFKIGDMVRVIVTVKPGEGKRRVKASEKTLFLTDVATQLSAGLAGVTGEVIKKLNIGALLKVTTPGSAFNFIGLLHFNSIPGGQRALEAIAVGKSMEIDITRARVDEEKGLLKLTLDAFGAQRREIEHRFPAGINVSANISRDLGDSFLLKLKSGDQCLLPKAALNGVDPDTIKVGRSTNAFVVGVDARGMILLSKSMPE